MGPVSPMSALTDIRMFDIPWTAHLLNISTEIANLNDTSVSNARGNKVFESES
jgi:hypothetical protein